MSKEIALMFLFVLGCIGSWYVCEVVNKKNKRLAPMLCVLLLTLVALAVACCSCTKTAMKRIVRTELIQCCHLPSPVVTEYTAFTHYEFLMRSKMEGAEMVVDGDYRHLAIESREQMPDPKTIKAIIEALNVGDIAMALKLLGVGYEYRPLTE